MREQIKVVKDPQKIRLCTEKTRHKLLSLLLVEDMTIPQLSKALGRDQSTIFRHIKKLKQAGLVAEVGDRKEHHVPQKMYGRTAKVFILVPEPSDTEESDYEKEWRHERLKRALETMSLIGVQEDWDEELIEKLDTFFLELSDKIAAYLEDSRVGKTDPYTFKVIEKLLLLVEIREDDEFGEKADELVDELVAVDG